MATTTRVKQWGFDTASDYTLGGDATIAASALSMTAPALPLPFDGSGWDAETWYDDNGDALPIGNTYYAAQAGGEDLLAADGMLALNIKNVSAYDPLTHLTCDVWARHGNDNNDSIHFNILGYGLRASVNIFNINAASVLTSSTGGLSWPAGTWKSIFLRFCGAVAAGKIGDSGDFSSNLISKTASGKILLRCADTSYYWYTIGNGGAAAAPVFYYRRQGTCELKAASAYTIPLGTTALGRLVAVCDRLGDGTELLDITLQFKIDDGDWTDVPADGDLSGETFTAGTSTLLWRINDMDNANDCRYVPTVYAVVLTYEQTPTGMSEGGELKDVLVNIKAVLNADATLMAYEGWSGAHVSWNEVAQPELYARCGVLIEWTETPEEHRGAMRSGGALVNAIDETHSVKVRAAMRLMRDVEDMLIADDQLLDFTEDVLSVLRSETLSGTVHSATVKNRTPSTEYYGEGGEDFEPGDILLMVDIEVEVHSKPFTATRP